MSRSSLFLNSSSYVIDTFVDPIPIGRTRGLNVPITFELCEALPRPQLLLEAWHVAGLVY